MVTLERLSIQISRRTDNHEAYIEQHKIYCRASFGQIFNQRSVDEFCTYCGMLSAPLPVQSTRLSSYKFTEPWTIRPIFHFPTVTPIMNDPKKKERLQLRNCIMIANEESAWGLIKDRPQVVPASEVWTAPVDQSQQLLVTQLFNAGKMENWVNFIEWTRVQECYYLMRRADLGLSDEKQ